MTWTTPRTWTDGELVTAAELNTHIRDDLSDLRSSTDWIPVVFLNGWSNQSPGPPAQYKRMGSWVSLVGLVHGGTLATPAFTLLPGYRPSQHILLSGWGEDSIATNQQEDWRIQSDGNVVLNFGNNFAFSIAATFSIL